jgi:SAM-dependent methyltransferase
MSYPILDLHLAGAQQKIAESFEELAVGEKGRQLRNSVAYLLSKVMSDHLLLQACLGEGDRVLNIGCSLPIDEILFARRIKMWVAIDLGLAAVRAARKVVESELHPDLVRRLHFPVADALRLPFRDGSFDIACCFSTLDHIPGRQNRARAVMEMARVTRPGGWVVVTVPNKLDLPYSISGALRQRAGNAVYEHCFWPWEIRRLLTCQGLRIRRFASTSLNTQSRAERWLDRLGLHWTKYFGTRIGCLAMKVQ